MTQRSVRPDAMASVQPRQATRKEQPSGPAEEAPASRWAAPTRSCRTNVWNPDVIRIDG